MSKNTITVPVTMIAGEATVDSAVLAAKLAEFAANPDNFKDLAATEEFLSSEVPIGSHMTKKEIDYRISTWAAGDFAQYKNVSDTVTTLLKDPSRFCGKKGRSATEPGKTGGGYTRIS